ncbi:MAG: hypothetical protein ABW252_20575 [Polyangiales bacterium]
MKRSSIALLTFAVLVVAAGAWWLFWPRISLPANPLAAIPADAYGIARVKVDRVITSDAWKSLVAGRGEARGIERVEVLCGFNPLARIRELVVFARPAPDHGVPRVAFTARGDLRHAELLDCVKKITGGDASALEREDVEGIPTFRSKQGGSLAAFVGRDGIIGGDAESVRAAIHAMLAHAPSLAEDAQLTALYREVEQGSDVAVVSHWPDDVKPWLRSLVDVIGEDARRLEQLRALALNLTTSSGRITGGTVLVTAGDKEAAELVVIAQAAVARLLAIPGIGLTPAASVLRGVQMEARGARATFAGSIRIGTVEALMDLAPALEARRPAVTRQVHAPAAEKARSEATDGGR